MSAKGNSRNYEKVSGGYGGIGARDSESRGIMFTYTGVSRKDIVSYRGAMEALIDFVGVKYGSVIRRTTERLKDFKNPPPVKSDYASKKTLYDKALEFYLKQDMEETEKKYKCYSEVLSMCDVNMKRKLQSLPEWEDMDDKLDLVKLLNAIKGASFGKEEAIGDEYDQALVGLRLVVNCHQGEKETLQDFHARFLDSVDVAEGAGVSFKMPVLRDLEQERLEEARTRLASRGNNQKKNSSSEVKKILQQLLKSSAKRARGKPVATAAPPPSSKDDEDIEHDDEEVTGPTQLEQLLKDIELGSSSEDDDDEDEIPAEDTSVRAGEKSKQKLLARMFLNNLQKTTFGRMLEDLANDKASGFDRTPNTVAEAFTMAMNRRDDPRNQVKGKQTTTSVVVPQEGVAFAAHQKTPLFGKKPPNGEKKRENTIECWGCGEFGHYRSNCPNTDEEKKPGKPSAKSHYSSRESSKVPSSFSSQPQKKKIGSSKLALVTELLKRVLNDENDEGDAGHGMALTCTVEKILSTSTTSRDDDILGEEELLCDNEASVSVFRSRKLLTNVRKAITPIKIAGVGGSIDVDLVGTFADFGEVYYHPECLANILCFADLAKQYKVSYDSAIEDAFVVTRKDGSEFRFVPKNKMYRYDFGNSRRKNADEKKMSAVLSFTNKRKEQDKKQVSFHLGVAAAATVEENKKRFTPRDVKRADAARRLYRIMCRPSLKDFQSSLGRGNIGGCPLTLRDAKIAEEIYGTDLGVLKGRAVRETPDSVRILEAPPLPMGMETYSDNVELCVDVMFVDRIPFLVCVSKHIQFVTVKWLASRSMDSLLEGVKETVAVYRQRGMTVRALLSDGERGFAAAVSQLRVMGIRYNPTTKNEHVERVIRVSKRCGQHIGVPKVATFTQDLPGVLRHFLG